MVSNAKLSGILQEEDKLRDAVGPQRRAVAVCRHWSSAFPTDLVAHATGPLILIADLVELGRLLCITGQLDEGEKVYAEALGLLSQVEKAQGADIADVVWGHCVEMYVNLGSARAEAGRQTEAQQAFDQAFALIQQRSPNATLKETTDGHEFHKQAEAMHWRARGRIGMGNLLLAQGHAEQAGATFREAKRDFEELLKKGGLLGGPDLEYASFLVACPVKELLDSAKALDMAGQVIEKETGRDSPDRSLLALAFQVRGLAHYRAGKWAACRDAAREASIRRDKCGSRFIQALACFRLGDKPQALVLYNSAAQRMEANQTTDSDLRRLRAEAAELLGIKDAPPGEKKPPMPKP